MLVRLILAAVAAGAIGAPLVAHGQARGRGGAPPATCEGECSERREETLRELARARADLARLAALLAQRGDSLDPATLAAVRSQLSTAMRNLERSELRVREVDAQRLMVTRVRPRVSSEVVSNTGWLGVSFSSNFRIVAGPGETRLFHFQEYPVVEAVEPASPARSAGIEVGDLLLAFKDRDLRAEPIALDEMLSPGSRLPVRLKRGSATRTVTVIVGERPRGAWSVEVDPPARAPRPPTTPEVWVPSPAPTATLLPPQAPVHVYALSSSIVTLAGAEMAQLPVEMREQVGASGGLLVLRVGQGTPASRAGLRSGDVLVKVNGKAIGSSRDLRAAFESSDRTLALDLVRKRETMSVRMTW